MGKQKNQSILIISDTHFPYHHPDTFAFLCALKKEYKPDKVLHIGDELDYHALSFHQSDPDLMGASCEFDRGVQYIQQLHEMFPVMDLMESNHGSMVYRKAFATGIPSRFLKDYRETLGVSNGWTWHSELILKPSKGPDILFHHALSSNALKASQQLGMNCVFGHHHNKFSIQYWSSGRQARWGMSVGCLIDLESMAFAYGKNNLAKPIIGCGLIINGQPKLAKMNLDKKNRWDRSL